MPFAAVAAANCINIPLMRQRWVVRAPRPRAVPGGGNRTCVRTGFAESFKNHFDIYRENGEAGDSRQNQLGLGVRRDPPTRRT